MKKQIRIGAGAGFAGDRIEPAVDLATKGNLDYLVFECLAERTIALAQLEQSKNANAGFNPLLEERIMACLPVCYQNKVKIISNMGAANPLAAARKTIQIAQQLGIRDLKVAAITGDDVLSLVKEGSFKLIENGQPLDSIRSKIISANAYLGVAGIVEALQHDTEVILCGRVADPSLFLAPLVYEFNWKMNDFEKLAKGTLMGHLLECAAQVSGGYFADANKKIVPRLWEIGFPFAEVDKSGEGYISKVAGTGGIINVATCTEQLLYEIHDPANYLTPDCVADFSKVNFEVIGKDQVQFSGANGKKATETYKVSVGYTNGYQGEGQISYGGIDAVERANLAADIIKKRLDQKEYTDLKFELIGFNSISPPGLESEKVSEVRLRVSGKTDHFKMARKIGQEVEALYTNGPSAGGGVTRKVEEIISIASILLPKTQVRTEVVYLKS